MKDNASIPIGITSEETTESDPQFKIVKLFVPIRFGSLWWGRDDLIHEKQPVFCKNPDRHAHPLLSIKRDELKDRTDFIPMLVGTSGRNLSKKTKRGCVTVRGITQQEPNHESYFGSIVAPGFYGFDDILDGVIRKKQSFRRPEKLQLDAPYAATERLPWHELRTMHPNHEKPRVNEKEEQDLNRFCRQHNL